MKKWLSNPKKWARAVKRDVVALWIGAGDKRTPLTAKIVAGAVAAYALSPIDLIPDFIPVLGYLDDVLIVPLGILLAVHLIPAALMNEFRVFADQRIKRPTSTVGLIAIVSVWIGTTVGCIWLAWSLLSQA